MNRRYEEMLQHLKLFEEAISNILKMIRGDQECEEEREEKELVFFYQTLTEEVCRGCPSFRDCYVKRKKEIWREMTAMLQYFSAKQQGKGNPTSEYFRRNCVYYASFVQEGAWLYRMMLQNRYWQQKIEQIYKSMEKQLYAQQLLMKQCRQGQRELISEAAQTEDTKAVWKHSGDNLLYYKDTCDFYLLGGCARKHKKGQFISGDTYSFSSKKDTAIVILSDGMGTGQAAYEESEKLIESYESMVEAGMEEEVVLRIMNHMLFLKRDNNMQCSTLDVAAVSIKTGMLKIMKAGGAATFIKHEASVERILMKNLPPGCFDPEQFELVYKKLYAGDIVILVSDGVLDFERDDTLLISMEEIIAAINTQNAQKFAEELMEAVPEIVNGYDDDQTILVLSIWEKGRKDVEKSERICSEKSHDKRERNNCSGNIRRSGFRLSDALSFVHKGEKKADDPRSACKSYAAGRGGRKG